jgi:hypothetical protein
MRRLAAFLLLALLAAAPLAARVGERGADLRKRFGKPEATPNRHTIVWLIEAPAGALLYTVTLNDAGVSIAEGLKPYRRAVMSERSARDFIADQLAGRDSSPTLRTVKTGEPYTFGGEAFVCNEDELVYVDDANDVLIIWTQRPIATVMAVTKEMVQRAGR